MLNRVVLIGRLTRDPELRYTQNGTAVASFTVAVNRKYNRDEADFIPVVVWQKMAENVAEYLGKGSLVAIEGRIQTRNYENQEGRKVYVTEVIADDVRFLDSRKKESPPEDDWSGIGTEIDIDDDEPF